MKELGKESYAREGAHMSFGHASQMLGSIG